MRFALAAFAAALAVSSFSAVAADAALAPVAAPAAAMPAAPKAQPSSSAAAANGTPAIAIPQAASSSIIPTDARDDLLPPTYSAPPGVPALAETPEPSSRRVYSGYPPETDLPIFQINMLSVNESHAKWAAAEQAYASGAGLAPMVGIPASASPTHAIDLEPWIAHVLGRGVPMRKVQLELSRLSVDEFKRWATRSN